MQFLNKTVLLFILLLSLFFCESGKNSFSEIDRLSSLHIGSPQFVSITSGQQVSLRSVPVVSSTKIKIRIKAGEPNDILLCHADCSFKAIFVVEVRLITYQSFFRNRFSEKFSLRGPPVV